MTVCSAGGGLLLGCRPDEPGDTASTASVTFASNAFVRVGADNVVTVILPQAEMGQGVFTALPMLVAEELEVGLDQVRVEHAPGDDRIFANPLFGLQIEGGVIYGISAALWGEITVKNGRVEQSNFSDYRVLRLNETPTIEVHLVPSSEPPGGIGEPGTAATAPALANAVYSATGKRIRRLPLQKPLMTR